MSQVLTSLEELNKSTVIKASLQIHEEYELQIHRKIPNGRRELQSLEVGRLCREQPVYLRMLNFRQSYLKGYITLVWTYGWTKDYNKNIKPRLLTLFFSVSAFPYNKPN